MMLFKDFNRRGWHRSEKIFQDQGKVREFHFESGKVYIFVKVGGK